MAAVTSPGTSSLTLTDPIYEKAEPGFVDRFFLSLINDPRDLPFVRLSASFALVIIPCAMFLFFVKFSWWLGVAYLALNFFVFVDRCILMLHCTVHRPLYKAKYKILNNFIPWVIGPFFGETPETFFGHHMGMHHPENNLKEDLSSTMKYQRDSFLGFLHYWGTFMTTTIVRLPLYLWRKGRNAVAIRTLTGEITFYVVLSTLLYLKPGPTVFVVLLPWLMVRWLMMWGNWGQHAFVDAKEPGNCYKNSITCINARYNRRCFNDGYHISHHWKANRHWTEHPQELLDNQADYAANDAIVFEGLDFFMVSFYLFLGRRDWLADRFVQLGEKKKSREEILALLDERLKPIR